MALTRASAQNSGVASQAPAATVASPFQKYTPGMGISEYVFYDEPVPAYELERNNASHVFPPDGINLSDVWVVKIVQSDLSKEDRYRRWPAVFSSRILKTNYQNKGTASKHQDSTKKWKYDMLFGSFEMHGEEGRNAGMVFNYRRKTTTKREIGDGQLCLSEIAAAAGTSEAAALAPSTTRELPAAANTDPNQSSRDATSNVGATKVTTGSRAKRQIGAGAEKEGPRPKRQRQNVAGETSKGVSKTPGPKFHIPDVIRSEEKGKDNVTELGAQNVKLRSKLGRSERKVVLLAETLAQIHESIQPLILTTSQAAENDGEHDGDGNSAEDSGHGKSAGSATD